MTKQTETQQHETVSTETGEALDSANVNTNVNVGEEEVVEMPDGEVVVKPAEDSDEATETQEPDPTSDDAESDEEKPRGYTSAGSGGG